MRGTSNGKSNKKQPKIIEIEGDPENFDEVDDEVVEKDQVQ